MFPFSPNTVANNVLVRAIAVELLEEEIPSMLGCCTKACMGKEMLLHISKRRYANTCRAMVSSSESTIPDRASTERRIRVVVHGKDCISSGSKCALAWFRAILEVRSELKTTVVGHGASDAREGRVLNRIIWATADGWEYEGD